MASGPSYKDYGIPDSLAVPTGEMIQGWNDAKAANLSRIILYNLDVVYSTQKGILRRLDREDINQDRKLSDEQLARKLQVHEWNNRDRTPPTVDGSVAMRPKTALGVSIEQYLESATAAPEVSPRSSRGTDGHPPLIHRFVKRDEGIKDSSSSGHVPVKSELNTPTHPNTTSQLETTIQLDTTAQLNTTAMAPSDDVTSDLAGLVLDTPAPASDTSSFSPPHKPANDKQPDLAGLIFDTPAPAAKTSPPSPSAKKANDEEPVSLSVPDVFLWERLHKLGAYDDNNNGSVSPTESVKQEHLDLLYSTTESADHAANLPVLQPAPEAKASSPLLQGGSTEKSVSIRAPSSIMAPGFEMPRIYDIPKANENFTQAKPKPQVGEPEWMNMTVSEAMRNKPQGPMPARSPALFPAASKAKGKAYEDPLIGRRASTFATTTTTTTSSMPTSKNFSQWRAQAEQTPVKQSTKVKAEEYTFW